MNCKEQERRQHVSCLAAGINDLGFYANQYGPEIIVKKQAGAARGYSILFGMRHTYLNRYDRGFFEELPYGPHEILGEMTRIAACTENGPLDLQGTPSPESRFPEALVDIDALQRLFPPEYPLETVSQFAAAQGVPCALRGQEIFVGKRKNPDEVIGSLVLIENLWHLRVPGLDLMRIDDRDVLSLVYHLEETLKIPTKSSLESLRGFGARYVP